METQNNGQWWLEGSNKSKDVEGRAGSVHTSATKLKEAGRKSISFQPLSRPNPLPPLAQGKEKKRRKRPPRIAAVVITCPSGGYKENLRLAVEKIDLSSLGIERMGAKRAVTGAHIF